MTNQHRWTARVEVSPNDTTRLKSYIGQETKFFNHIVDTLAPWVRSAPEEITRLDEEMLGLMAAYNLVPARDMEIHPKLTKWTEQIRGATDRDLSLWNCVNHQAVLVPGVRMRMVEEIIRDMKNTIDMMNTTNRNGEQLVPATVIQRHDGLMKRHIQIDPVSVKWSADKKSFTTPYTKEPIVVNASKIPNFKALVLRQVHTKQQSHWEIELIFNKRYVTRMLDPLLRIK